MIDPTIICNGILFTVEYDYADDTGATWYAYSEDHEPISGNGHDLELIKEEIESVLIEEEYQTSREEDEAKSFNAVNKVKSLHPFGRN
jgi:hypothetical protein